jgi:hypothetical protein
MATRYWVGGTGNWDSTSTANWSTTSGGSSGASAPTYADNVIFDALSNATAYTVTFIGGFTGAGSISGTVLTVTSVFSGAITVGATILPTNGGTRLPSDAGYILGGTYITSFGTGTGGVGTYNISISQTVPSQNISAGPACADISIAAPLTGAITFGGAATSRLSIYGSMTVTASSSTLTWSSIAPLVFCANTTGKTISTNGTTIGSGNSQLLILDGIGGGWTLGSALTVGFTTYGLAVFNGSFSTGNFALTSGALQSYPSGTRSISLGSSAVTLSSAVGLNFVSGAGLTFNAGTSTIICSTSNVIFAGGDNTFYNVSFSNTGANSKTINGANIFNNLTFSNNTSAGRDVAIFSANQTINGTLTLGTQGTTTRRFVRSDVVGAQRTLTLATAAAFSSVDFQDIAISGAASPIAGTSSIGNNLRNSGITFSTPKTVYWSLAAGGAGNSNGWAATSGGTPTSANFPLAQDTLIIQNTGLNSGATLTFGAYAYGNINISDRTLPMTWGLFSTTLFYGYILLTPAVTITGVTVRTGTAADTYTISGTASGVLTPIVNVSVNTFGISSTALTNDVSVSGKANVSPTGIAVSGYVGNAVAAAAANAFVSGLSGTSALGTVTLKLGASIFPDGISSDGFIGDLSIFGKANVSPTGTSATSAVTAATVYLQLKVYSVGVSSTTYVGTLTAYGKANVYPTGPLAYGYIGQALVWGLIVPYQNPAFSSIAPIQSPGYNPINPSQTASWVPVVT